MKIVVTGSIAFDYIMTFPGVFRDMLLIEGLEHISVSFLVDGMTKHNGGTGPNVCYTLALLRERPRLVGTAGADFNEYQAFLDRCGVDTGGVVVYPDVFTASFFVTNDSTNSQIAVFHTGAMARARTLSLKKATGGHADLVVITPNDPEAMRNYVRECKQLGIPYVYDPSQQVARVEGAELAEGVKGAYMLVVNEAEWAVLRKKTGLTHDEVKQQVEVVVITRSADGADIYTDDGSYHIPIFPTDRIIDPTGVGDAFRAGLLKGVANGWPWEISGRVGAVAAVYTLEQFGTQNHSFTPADFAQRFRQHFDDQGALDALLHQK